MSTCRRRGSSSTIRQYGAVMLSTGMDWIAEVARHRAASSPPSRRGGGLASPLDLTRSSIGMTRVFDDDLDAAFGTRAIHAGQRPEPLAGAIMTPIYQTSTYVQEALGENKGYEYARGKNP